VPDRESPKSKPQHRTKREIAAEQIRNAVETGFYRPGEVVSQRRIGEDFGLSVTPIREAIIELSAAGLIERHSHHSIKIAEVDAERLREIYRVRALIEGEAIRLAFGHTTKAHIAELKAINRELKALIGTDELNRIHALDRRFHDTVFLSSRNRTLISCIGFMRASFSVYALWRSPGRLPVSVREHARFVKCLAAGDLAGCLRQHDRHLESGLNAAIAANANEREERGK
jgi:DNA-binding GntR family transcriptional regulator